jgi:hypothetical protein
MLLAQQARPGMGEAFVGAVLALVISIAIGSLIGAVLIRAACWLYNRLAGGPGTPGAVPEPEFGQALGIAFVTALANGGVGFLLGILGVAAHMSPIALNVLPLPLSLLVGSWMVSLMLPTTFTKGLLVMLVYFLIGVCIAVFVIVVLVAVGITLL